MKPPPPNPSFVERGGLWVLAQLPVLLLAAVIPVWSGAARFEPTHPVQGIGTVLTAAGLVMATLGLVHLGKALTPFPRPLEHASLRSGGVYALVRHPIYSGLLLSTVGWALWWLSAPGLAYAALVALFFDRKAAREEAWLEAKYNEQYAAYRKRVRKFLPWIY